MFNEYRVSVCKNEKVLEMHSGDSAQQCGCATTAELKYKAGFLLQLKK